MDSTHDSGLTAWEAAARAFEKQASRVRWRDIARPEQLPPDGDWLVWAFIAGRGAGKTRSAAEYAHERAMSMPGSRGALIGRTPADVRDVMIEGEALALDTVVPTPDGFVVMADVQVGDVILGGDGRPCRVVEAFPVLHGRPCYRVVIKGGVEIVADAGHKWLTEDYRTRADARRLVRPTRRAQVRTTKEIASTLRYHCGLASQANHGIAVSAAGYVRAHDQEIDPYVLGAWLGDGTAKAGEITTADLEMLEHFESAGYTIRAHAKYEYQGIARVYGVLGLRAQLRRAGLLRNKHVPPSYLRANAATRLAVLQGLMDTDGCVSQRGQCEFVNKNRDLADAVVDLACSLGIKASAPRAKASRVGTTHWLVKFTTTQPVFRLERKLERIRSRCRDDEYWYIQDAVPVDSVPVRCIAVDSPDRTFLITNHYIRTHNSGLLAVGGEDAPIYQSTKRRVTWPNGSMAYAYSAEVPSQLRGPQHHWAWADEPSSWTDAPRGDTLDTAWNNLMLGLRLGLDPRCVFTTTPKPNALVRTVLARKSTVVTRGTTYDNLANLAPSFREEVLATYEGTRIGRQELLGELLEDVEGALWTLALIENARVTRAPEMRRIVVAVDPSGGMGPNHDEQGIIVGGLGVDGDLYVLADRSCSLSPHGWASRAVAAYREFSADRIVAERNYGGDMVEATIRQVDLQVPVKVLTASRGKVQRAEPVAALYERGLVHHVGALPKLEDQMTQWTPQDGTSPDRLDGLVWLVTELTDNFSARAWIDHFRRKAEEAARAAEAEREQEAQVHETTAALDPVAARQAARNAALRGHLG